MFIVGALIGLVLIALLHVLLYFVVWRNLTFETYTYTYTTSSALIQQGLDIVRAA
jgi:ABC-type transporter Mla subunit MlaD